MDDLKFTDEEINKRIKEITDFFTKKNQNEKMGNLDDLNKNFFAKKYLKYDITALLTKNLSSDQIKENLDLNYFGTYDSHFSSLWNNQLNPGKRNNRDNQSEARSENLKTFAINSLAIQKVVKIEEKEKPGTQKINKIIIKKNKSPKKPNSISKKPNSISKKLDPNIGYNLKQKSKYLLPQIDGTNKISPKSNQKITITRKPYPMNVIDLSKLEVEDDSLSKNKQEVKNFSLPKIKPLNKNLAQQNFHQHQNPARKYAQNKIKKIQQVELKGENFNFSKIVGSNQQK